METNTYDCTRCEGKGRIHAFGHVVGGVCFKCGGSGKQKGKPACKLKSWAIWAVDCETMAEVGPVFHVRAKNERDAEAKARLQLARGKGYTAESARAVAE